MPELNYDDGAASIFGVTLLLLYLIPALWYIIHRYRTCGVAVALDGPEAQKPRSRAEAVKAERLSRLKKPDVLMTTGFKLLIFFTAVAALLFAYLLIRVSGQTELAQYDPYTILGIVVGATDGEIRQAYRKLARLHHPDLGGDAEMFQKVKLAYDALTDPAIKENMEKYGNPNGRQRMDVSIGLPAFLKGGAGWLLLVVYMGLLVVAVPAVMCMFYRKNKDRDAATGLHNGTLWWLGHRLQTFPEGCGRAELLPEVVGGCVDFLLDFPPAEQDKAPLAELKKELEREHLFAGVSPPDAAKKRNNYPLPPEAVARHVLLLLHHCNRSRQTPAGAPALTVRLPASLLALQISMLKRVASLVDILVPAAAEIEGFSERRAAQAAAQGGPRQSATRYFDSIRAMLEFQQMVTQGLWVGDSSLRQIFSAPAVAALYSKANKGGRRPHSLAQFLDIVPAEERPILPTLTDAEREDVAAVLPDLPRLVLDVVAAVADCDDVRELDIVTVTVTVRHANLATPASPVPAVYAPAFPYPRPEEWWLVLVDEKQQRNGTKRIVAPAFTKLVPAKATETVKLQFQAPAAAGEYEYALYALSTGYMGLDVRKEVALTVLERLRGPARAAAAGGGGADGKDEDEAAALAAGEVTLENLLGGSHRDGAAFDSDLEEEEEEETAEGGGKAGDDGEQSDDPDVPASEEAAGQTTQPSAAKGSAAKSKTGKNKGAGGKGKAAAAAAAAVATNSAEDVAATNAAAAAAAALLAEEDAASSSAAAGAKEGGDAQSGSEDEDGGAARAGAGGKKGKKAGGKAGKKKPAAAADFEFSVLAGNRK